MSLIQAVFGKDSPHYEHFDQAYQKCAGYDDQVDPLKGILERQKLTSTVDIYSQSKPQYPERYLATLLALRNLLFEKIQKMWQPS